MAEKDQSRKRAQAAEGTGTPGAEAPKTGRRARAKRAAAPQEKPPRAQASVASPRRTSGKSRKAEEAAASQKAEKTRAEQTEYANALSENGRVVAAQSWRDMMQGVDAMAAAEGVAKLSRVAALAGARDVSEGTRVLAASQDIVSQSLAMGSLSEEDLGLGLTLAAIAGQVRAMIGVVDNLGTSVVAGFLDSRGEQLAQLAETLLLRAGATGALAKALADTGMVVAELGQVEVAEGEAAFRAAEREAERGEELADEGLGLMAVSLVEAAQAQELQDQADALVAEAGAGKPENPEA